jgi:glycosyltransferase involved in cell wall biosynthesis
LRIAVLTRYVHDAGGVEAYLKSVLPALAANGHELALWHEFAVPSGWTTYTDADLSCRLLKTDRIDRSVDEVRGWKPDVLFLNGLSEPAVEMRLIERTPTVTFLHGYHGTCVSGGKTHMFPAPVPCERQLGAGCLLHYYPRRCGGWNPLVMVEGYRKQRIRQQLLHRSAFVTTFSEHMRREAISNGVDQARAVHLPAFNPAATPRAPTTESLEASGCSTAESPVHVAFIGRMERPKGAHVLMDALALLDDDLRSRLKVTFAGDGREKAALEQTASGIAQLRTSFPGWISACDRERLLSTIDLLVVPSIWPEPLGLVGIEAAAAGVPAIAFDVGGIRDWLEDDVTGRLVPAPPSSAALATALTDALRHEDRLKAWGRQARKKAGRLTLDAHVSALEDVFRRAAVRPS